MEKSKQFKYVLFGVLFWFFGAMFVRFTGDFFFTGSMSLKMILLAVTFPMAYSFIKIANPAPNETMECTVIMTYAATFLDGLALTFFRQLYHESLEICLFGAAAILFGGAAGLLLGHIMNVDIGIKGKR